MSRSWDSGRPTSGFVATIISLQLPGLFFDVGVAFSDMPDLENGSYALGILCLACREVEL